MVYDNVRNDESSDSTPFSSQPSRSSGDVTRILSAIENGDGQAAEQLLPVVYDELRRLALLRMANEKPGQTLQPTALVHEAYLRLVRAEDSPHWNSRGHFFCAAAEAMRRILIETARRKKQPRHGGEWQRVNLEEGQLALDSPDCLLELDEALARLEAHDDQLARLVKLRFFAGLTMPEAAEALGIPLRKAERNWTYARTLLYRDLAEESPPEKSPRKI
jgi:RNA polymerase sigma factor (TIGR02999 family)